MEKARIFVSENRYQWVFKEAFEVRRKDGTQVTNKEGVALWEISCVNTGKGMASIRVVLSAAEKPAIENSAQVEFENLDAQIKISEDGKKLFIDYYADGVTAKQSVAA